MKAPAKAELKWRIEQLEAELEKRRAVGKKMADFCFYILYGLQFDYRIGAKRLYKEWDAIKRVAP